MKNLLISAGIFSLGIGVGVLASKTYFDKKYQQMAEEEIESFRQYVERAKKKIEDNDKKLETSGYLETLEPYPTNPSLYTTTSADTIPYNEHYQTESKIDEAKTLSPEEDEPYEITIEEYTEDEEFDKVTLNYYMEDGMLIYEEGEDVADETIIGSENLDDFASVPLSQAYYRDPKKNIDYEVIKVDGSYQELVAGI